MADRVAALILAMPSSLAEQVCRWLSDDQRLRRNARVAAAEEAVRQLIPEPMILDVPNEVLSAPVQDEAITYDPQPQELPYLVRQNDMTTRFATPADAHEFLRRARDGGR